MKVKSLMLRNFAKVSEILVNFSDSVTFICGANGAGKSSIGLNAIWFIMKGLAQKGDGLIAERFRFIGPDGKTATGTLEIFDERDSVTHVVTRKLRKDKTELEIKSSDGVQRGEEFLSSLFSAILIDPMRFSKMSGKEQALALGIDTSDFDKRRKELEDERLLVGREVKRLKGLADTSRGTPRAERVSIMELLAERKEAEEFNAEIDEQIESYSALVTEKEEAENEVNRLREELHKADQMLKDLTEEMNTVEIPPQKQDLTEIDRQIEEAEETNTKAKAYEDALQQQRDYQKGQAEYDALSDEIKKVDGKRAEYLQGQDLPFENITIEDGEFRLDGKPFRSPYFSTGECLKFGTQLGAKIMSDKDQRLDYVWIPDCQDLDENNRAELFKWLVGQNFQVVAEIVDLQKQDQGYSILLHEMELVGEELA